MTLFRPRDLIPYLETLQAKPLKKLSQNFLIDGNIIAKLLDAADIKPKERVIEIGPGPGAITDALLERGAHVIACERDPLFTKALRERPHQRLTIIEADALEEDFTQHLPAKIVSNIPFHITSPLLARLLPLGFTSITFLLQEEVAKRIVAKPRTSDYGRLSLLVQLYSEPTISFSVSPNSFYPKPKVRSAVVHMKIEKKKRLKSEKIFFDLTKRAFQQRRKMLRTSLKELQIAKTLEEIGSHSMARPEELSLEEFIALSNALSQ